MEQITETMNVQDSWYEAATKQTLESLPEFLRHLLKDYGHDYGTICHALAAGMVGAGWAMDKDAGITRFQAGEISWEIWRHWLGVEGPAKLVRYQDMLYPQYESHFYPTITTDTWVYLQREACRKIGQYKRNKKQRGAGAAPAVIRHWRSIVNYGKVPFYHLVKDN